MMEPDILNPAWIHQNQATIAQWSAPRFLWMIRHDLASATSNQPYRLTHAHHAMTTTHAQIVHHAYHARQAIADAGKIVSERYHNLALRSVTHLADTSIPSIIQEASDSIQALHDVLTIHLPVAEESGMILCHLAKQHDDHTLQAWLDIGLHTTQRLKSMLAIVTIWRTAQARSG